MEHNSIKDIAQMIKEMGGKKVQNNAAVAVDGSNALDVAMTTITYPENRVVNQTEQENKAPESPVDERKTGGAIDNAHLKIKSLTRELIEGQDYFRLEKVPNAILSKAGQEGWLFLSRNDDGQNYFCSRWAGIVHNEGNN